MFDDLYNQRILALAADIPFQGKLNDPDGFATAHSKLCGSTVKVQVKLDHGAVKEFRQEVKACALGQAASSIMGRHVIGSTIQELISARDQVRAMLKENGPTPTGRFAEAAVLQPVKDFKARHASTLLTFEAAVEAVKMALESDK